MMNFIELRFGQGTLGEKLIDGKPGHEQFVQRELVPVKAIKDAFIILPEKRNIQITFKHGGREFTRIEYYRNEIDCIKRWCMLKKACGITARFNSLCPVPLAADADELEQDRLEAKAREAAEKAKAHQERMEREGNENE